MTDSHTAFTGSIPEHYDRYLGPLLFEEYALDLARRLSVPAGGTVLETAAGTGIVTRHLQNVLPPDVKIVVTDLQENTFYAVIHLRMNGDRITIDSRPSDAIALALRTDAPIYVTEEVINNSRNISLEKENLDSEDIKKWLENLNPDDMGKYKM